MAIELLDDLGISDAVYQWDSNRMVRLTGDDKKATRVDFGQYNLKGETLSTEVKDLCGQKVADIPNVLLQDDRDIICYSVIDTVYEEKDAPQGCKCCGDAYVYSETINDVRLKVIGRNRPPDYIYTQTDVIRFEDFKRWVKKEIKKAVKAATDYNALDNKPSINGVVLEGYLTLSDLGLYKAAKQDIAKMFDKKKEA